MLTEQVIAELSEQNLIYYNPATDEWELAEEYLSGNIREKLAIAQQSTDPRVQKNIAPLKQALPPPCLPNATPEIKAECALTMGIEEITPEIMSNTIKVRLGANWIGEDTISKFVCHLINAQENYLRVSYEQSTNSWTIKYWAYSEANKSWGAGGMNATEIIECLLNQKEIKVWDGIGDNRVVDPIKSEQAKGKGEEIQEKFEKWVWSDLDRSIKLTQIYNEKFNSHKDRTYDGSHIELIGSNPKIQLRPHQKNGIWRILQSKTVLLPYKVGYGKTFTMIGGIMELKRLKLAQKPMLVVLNSTLGQITKEFKRLYPTAKLLIADSASDRRKFVAKVATGTGVCAGHQGKLRWKED